MVENVVGVGALHPRVLEAAEADTLKLENGPLLVVLVPPRMLEEAEAVWHPDTVKLENGPLLVVLVVPLWRRSKTMVDAPSSLPGQTAGPEDATAVVVGRPMGPEIGIVALAVMGAVDTMTENTCLGADGVKPLEHAEVQVISEF